MASVRLNGDTSGFIEISAPSVAGSTTITLPATSGGDFLVTDSNGDLNVDSGTLFVDASTNRVGIGTTSPATTFVVDKSDASGLSAHILVNNSESSSGLSLLGAGSSFSSGGWPSLTDCGIIRSSANSSNGVAIQAPAGAISFWNSSEAARIDSSGRLLVGTSTTALNHRIQVVGASDASAIAVIGRVADDISEVTFYENDQTTRLGELQYRQDHLNLRHRVGDIRFATGGATTERMRITSTGAVCINSTDTTMNTFGAIFTPASNTTTQPSVLNFSKTHSGSIDAVVFRYNGSRKGSIQFSDSGTSFNTTSDYRVKENISPLSNAATRLNQLKVYSFNFIADPDTVVDGFIAHEAQSVVPECVTGTKDEVDDDGNPIYQGIDQSKLVPLLTAALQEALAKIETLETRLTALEGGN
jgi:hypothetical protein